MPIQTAQSLQHLSKVRSDLSDTRDALSLFFDTTEDDCVGAAHVLSTAIESLLRALSTLTQVVEDLQPRTESPATAPTGWMFS